MAQQRKKAKSSKLSLFPITLASLGLVALLFITVALSVKGGFFTNQDTRLSVDAAGNVPNYDNAIADANWMMQASIVGGTMDGALASYIDKQHIRPYQANLGALGLARASHISGDPTYVNAVWKHLYWYQSHMDASNYVHDWDLINGVWTEAPNSVLSGPYDSTDSYAATFLLAARAAYNANPDMSKLSGLRVGITNALTAIRSTQQSDGLTWATPTYHGKLTEDNAETYQGLIAGRDLFMLMGDTANATQAQSYANVLFSGFESLWLPANNAYGVQKSENGVVDPPNWQRLSPDAMAQGWTTAFRLTTVQRGQTLLAQLNSNQPNWDQPSLNGNNYDVAPIGWAYYYTGNPVRAQQSATNLRTAAITSNRSWPFNTMAAGEIIITETEGENFVFQLLASPTPTLTPTTAPTKVPTATPRPPTPTPTPRLASGVSGYYYNNKTLSGSPRLTRIDTAINFNWKTGSPSPFINADNFSARWTGYIRVPTTGNYSLCTEASDGTRLWVNNVQLVNKWIDHTEQRYCGTISLQTGNTYPVVYEYYEATSNASAKLLWTTPTNTNYTAVPAANLFH